ncbi:MAG TPA: sulfatase-like hydrolase/transferase, partial [Flavisolibacter sp.]|nr:sulfatase-like hydrolase/transferase [Flavisolibacter sp.]
RIINESWNENSGKAGWWNRAPGQPFFSVFNYMEPHQGRTMTYPYEKYKKEIFYQLKNEERISDNDFEMPPFYNDSPEMRKQLARVYNSLKLTDNLIGNLLQRLQRDNLTDSTIIFFYADHGEGIPGAKTNGIGLGYRVPFIIWFPPMYQHLSPWGSGIVTDELISFEDLAPTLLSMAGVKKPAYMKGRAMIGADRTPPAEFIFCYQDRADESTDLVRTVTNGRYLYSRNFMPFMPEHRWLRYQEVSDIKKQIRKDFTAGKLNAVQKRMLQARPVEYLFDLHNDTWETTNLVNDASLKPLLEKMRNAMDENIIRSRDIHFLPEYEMALIAGNTLPYNYRLSNDNFDIEHIYKAAALSGKKNKSIAHQQLELLKHKNKIVRYWAAMGLKSQSAEVLRTHQSQLKAALKDTYPPVQILVASITYDLFNNQEAQRILKTYSIHENEHLSLLALQNIAYVKNLKPFAANISKANAKGRSFSLPVYAASEVLLSRLGLKNLEAQDE